MAQSTGSLLTQTRELFHHQGSDSELVQQIVVAIQAIDELCGKPTSVKLAK
jgi:hypothetical protein